MDAIQMPEHIGRVTPWCYAPIDPPVATHLSELPYVFDLPDAPFQVSPSVDQEALAVSMRTAWANFAASGDPSSAAVPWPSFDVAHVMSLVPPQPHVETDFASRHTVRSGPHGNDIRALDGVPKQKKRNEVIANMIERYALRDK